jgi:diacylglycerol kinase (ATP)
LKDYFFFLNKFDFFSLACGGDGTVGWVLSALDTSQMQYMDFVSVGVIPLGTGNDMARFLGLGVGYRGEALAPVIQALAKSESRLLDRWQIDVKPTCQTGTASLKVVCKIKIIEKEFPL